jgi:hypothetical protein
MPGLPIIYEATEDGLVPLPRFQNLYAAEFTPGGLYKMAEVEDRDMRSHRHFFASVREVWMNLPEQLAARFPSPDHLRKWCLIEEGYCKYVEFACKDAKAARIAAASVRAADQYAVIKIDRDVVRIWTAESQSVRAMGKERFQKSKWDALNRLAAMVGVSAKELRENAGEAA